MHHWFMHCCWLRSGIIASCIFCFSIWLMCVIVTLFLYLVSCILWWCWCVDVVCEWHIHGIVRHIFVRWCNSYCVCYDMLFISVSCVRRCFGLLQFRLVPNSCLIFITRNLHLTRIIETGRAWSGKLGEASKIELTCKHMHGHIVRVLDRAKPLLGEAS